MVDFVIIPAYNEGNSIVSVIEKTKKYTQNIIVVDDGSKDNTYEQAQAQNIITLRHKVNLGKGAALKTGCEYALAQGAMKLIAMDAYGQHDPKEIPSFLKELEQHEIVFSARKVPLSMPLILRFGNKFISTLLKRLYNMNIEDSQCGYRAFTADAYPKIKWDTMNYYVETEMIIKAGKHSLKHTQIPIETIYADKYKGTTVIDGISIVGKMIGWRLFK